MSNISSLTVATMGIDIGKYAFHCRRPRPAWRDRAAAEVVARPGRSTAREHAALSDRLNNPEAPSGIGVDLLGDTVVLTAFSVVDQRKPHEGQFVPPRLSGRSAFSEESFAARCGNAPKRLSARLG